MSWVNDLGAVLGIPGGSDAYGGRSERRPVTLPGNSGSQQPTSRHAEVDRWPDGCGRLGPAAWRFQWQPVWNVAVSSQVILYGIWTTWRSP